MYKLFLDDERLPEHVTWMVIDKGPWVLVRTQNEFESIIAERGVPDVISFDNDLGDGCGEGRFCARWLVDAILDGKIMFRPFTFTVHSKNPIAQKAIENLLNPFLAFMIKS